MPVLPPCPRKAKRNPQGISRSNSLYPDPHRVARSRRRTNAVTPGASYRNNGISQRERIASMLRTARAEECAVGIHEMMRAGISAFNGRIMELRRRGYQIENEMWRDKEGNLHSQYWLIRTPEERANEKRG